MTGKTAVWWLLPVFAWVFLSPSGATDDTPAVLEVGRFSTSPPGSAHTDGWKPLAFKKIPTPTAYELVVDADTVVVKATSNAAASGLIKEVTINPTVFPIVRWRWKVGNIH